MDKLLACFSRNRREYTPIDNTDELNRKLIKTVQGNDSEDEKASQIEELVQKGAVVNFNDSDRENNTPLHIAVRKGELKIIQLLLSKGASIENKNVKGDSSLDVAKCKKTINYEEIISLLEQHLLEQLEQKQKYFVENFVFIYERILSEYCQRLENRSTKPGKWADLLDKIIRITIGTSETLDDLGKAAMLVGISFLQNAISSILSAHNRRELKQLTRHIYLFKTDPQGVRRDLIESGICIFQTFESQFYKVSIDESGQRALTKLAEDAVSRIINYHRSITEGDFSPPFTTRGIIIGQSKTYRHATDVPHIKAGHTLKQDGCDWNTDEMFSKVGVVKRSDTTPDQYYKFTNKTLDGSKKYGYRLLFNWETNNELSLQERGYCLVEEPQVYRYILKEDKNEMLINELHDIINNSDPTFTQGRLKDVLNRIELDAEKKCKKIESIVSKHFKELSNYLENNEREIKNNLQDVVDRLETSKKEAEKHHEVVCQEIQHVGEKLQKVIVNIEKKLENNKQLRKAVWSNLRYSVKTFTGRDKQLNEIYNNIHQGRIVVISGLGGAGKSELAIKYARDNYTNNDSVVWIDAETQETAKESFRKLAKTLDIPFATREGSEVKPRNLEDIVKDIYDYFTDTKCLFIFDNAEKYNNFEVFLPFFLRPSESELNVLITSRIREWAFEAREVGIVELSHFTPSEANAFITISLKSTDNLQDIAKLGEDLQYFPLALKQAAAYINYRNENLELMGGEKFTVRDYLIEYKIEAKTLLNFQSNEIKWSYDKAILTTFKISTDKISKDLQTGENALNVLNIMAYLIPDRLIIREVFSKALPDESKLNNAIKLLHQHSIITVCNGISNIHRLVQQVTRINLAQKCQQVEVLNNALELFNNNLTSSNTDNCINIWNHIHSYVNLFDGDVSENTNVMQSKFKNLICKFSKLPSQIVNQMNDDIRYEEACSFGLRMSNLLQSILGDLHPDTLHLQINIAGVLFKQGKYDVAYIKYEDVLQKLENMENLNQNDILCTKLSKANVLYRQGKYDDALKMYKEVLDKGINFFGNDHDLTLSTMRSIAVVLNNKGEYEEALKMCNIIINKKLGKLDHDALSARHEKGRALDNLGRYKEAKDMYLETLAAQEKILGPHHYTTLYTMHGLGRALSNHGDYKHSLNIYEQLLAKRKNFGEDNPDYLATQNNIAVVYNKMGKYTQAMNLFEEVLEKRLASLGPHHPSTLYTLHGMAKVLKNQMQYEKSLEQFKEVLANRIKVLGPNHPATLSSRHELGEVLLNQGKYEESMQILEDVLERRSAHLSEKHPSTLSTRNALAEVLVKRGQLHEAMKIFQEVYEDRRLQLGEDHPFTLKTKCCIANALRRNGEHVAALELFYDILENCIIKLGEVHPISRNIRRSIDEMERNGKL